MKRILYFLYRRGKSLPAEFYLRLYKKNQIKKFEDLKNQFLQSYKQIKSFKSKKTQNLIIPLWNKYNKEVEKKFIPNPPLSFVRIKPFYGVVYFAFNEKITCPELKFLEEKISKEKLKKLLEEDYIGKPYISNYKYFTSNQAIHDLYHITRFEYKTKIKLQTTKSIIEWGGGYGNLAKIINRINPKITYVIIDLPIFSCIQWLYLSSILNINKINLIQTPKDTIEKGKINLLPLFFIKKKIKELNKLNSDIFIATCSLSESSKLAQDYVYSLNFFNSKHLILLYSKNYKKDIPNTAYLEKFVKKRNANIESIEFLSGLFYAFY